MTRAPTLALLMLAACGTNVFNAGVDALPPLDAGGCDVSIAITPATPVVGDHVHAAAIVTGAPGVPTYAWTLDGSAATAYEAADDSAIGFDVPAAVSHSLTVTVGGTTASCPEGLLTFNVANPTGNVATYRLRVVPPAGAAPPYESTVLVQAGQSVARDIPLDPGYALAGTITAGAVGVPAYIELVPASGVAIEAFSALTGAFQALVSLDQSYTAIVVPELAGYAPQAFAWSVGTTAFTVGAGQTASGTVLVPGGGGLAGAQVQLASAGVPSTIATTGSDGGFAVQETFAAGAQVSVTIVPPAASGLARLAATAVFDLTQPIAVAYASATPCDLAGDAVAVGGAAAGSAQVTIVGALGSGAATIATGAISAQATGSVVASGQTSASGALGSLPVPRAAGLFAVVASGTSPLGVAPIDTSACAAQSIAIPTGALASSVVTAGSGAPLAGVQIEATPTGPLALATLVPVDTTTGSDGSFSLALAGGSASYDVSVYDPAGRGAPAELTTVPSAIALGAAVTISGTVSVTDVSSALAGAAVELLCGACTGVAADRPIAQSATDVQGHYQLTVADPGAM